MKKVALFILYTTLFFALLIFFAPKENLYYQAEALLKRENIIISDEKVKDRGFSLELSDAKIYAMDGIQVARFEELTLRLLLAYNTLQVTNIELSSVAAKFIPTHVDHLNVKYTLLDPLHIKAEALGDFGKVSAVINLKTRLIHLKLEPSRLMKSRYSSSMRMLKKSKQGAYTYEYHF